MAVTLTIKLITVSVLILQNDFNHRFTTRRDHWNDMYDFIVVGSGSAGSVVAGRLSAYPGVKVLLLEAGGPANLVADMPAMGNLVVNSQLNWNYSYAQQWVGRGWKNGRIPSHRGKVLGGTSQINSMVYNRGNARDYDYWAQEFGAVGWAYQDLLPYFKRWENNTDPNIVNANPHYHNTKGPVQITTWRNPDPIYQLYIKSMNKLGHNTTNINGPVQKGTCIVQNYITGQGTRSSISNAYIDPNKNPQNLDIVVNALVTRVLFKGLNATGVEFIRKGVKHVVNARREVIVCAGAINSPQLLMLSGVGPAEHLRALLIPVVADLPVGQYLQNHMRSDVLALVADKRLVVASKQQDAGALTIDNEWLYFTNGSGPLTIYSNALTYLSTKTNADKDWPNVSSENRLRLAPTDVRQWAQAYDAVDQWTEYLRPYAGRHYMQFMPILQRVRSHGALHLVSNNPYDYPVFSPQYLADSRDYDDYYEVLKWTLWVVEKSLVSKYFLPIRPIPRCKVCPNRQYLYECNSYIKCHIMQNVYSIFHDVGTCRMGDPHRPDVVVNPRLQIKGLSGVRVCDTSVMPQLPNGNTNAAVITIGEKCSQMVAEDNYLI